MRQVARTQLKPFQKMRLVMMPHLMPAKTWASEKPCAVVSAVSLDLNHLCVLLAVDGDGNRDQPDTAVGQDAVHIEN